MGRKKDNTLKLSDIKKQAKQVYEQEKYELEDGKTITFYVTFPDLLIEEMIEELQRHLITLKEKELKLSDKMNLYLIHTMMIKYFTHFKKDMPEDVFAVENKAGLIDYLEYFCNTGLRELIIDYVFKQDQVIKVYDKLTNFIGTSLLLDQLGEQAQDHVKDLKLRHKDTFAQFAKMRENKVVQ